MRGFSAHVGIGTRKQPQISVLPEIVSDVDLAARVPRRELRATGAAPGGVVRLADLQVAVVDEHVPKPVDARTGFTIDRRGGLIDQFRVVVNAVLAHERGDVRRVDERRVGSYTTSSMSA